MAKAGVGHPGHAGFQRHYGWPQGQVEDWRLATSDGRSIHAREYATHFDVHWDRRDPRLDLLAHVALDSPNVARGAAALVGAWKGGWRGALSGLLIAELGLALAQASATDQETNQVDPSLDERRG